MTNTLAYDDTELITAGKSFVVHASGSDKHMNKKFFYFIFLRYRQNGQMHFEQKKNISNFLLFFIFPKLGCVFLSSLTP